MAKILVTGANGQLGSEVKELEKAFPKHQFQFVTKAELDISNEDYVSEIFNQFKPDYCINCAAYTAVDKAENDVEAAFAINANGVRNLAVACSNLQARLIHISTDYVFDGTAQSPYKDEDATNPKGVYGASKLKGEQEALLHNNESIIIRTSWVYSVHGNNFVKTMLRLMASKPEINVVSDQVGSPTYAADLAEAILQIIDGGKWQTGIYHYSNEGIISWYQFALAIKKLTNSTCLINPIPTEQYPTPAKRPHYSVLDKSKIQNAFGVPMKNWEESLATCLAAIEKNR